MNQSLAKDLNPTHIHPNFLTLVEGILAHIQKDELAELRKNFHARLRLTLNHPDKDELIKDLWDFFYDWCVFEQKLAEKTFKLKAEEKSLWEHFKENNLRGLFQIQKIKNHQLYVKDIFTGKSLLISVLDPIESLGIGKGDILEGRVVQDKLEKKIPVCSFLRRPSYHSKEVHDYILKKVKQFKKAKDENSYRNWLWILVGMYLKHRLYEHMPIQKIYDDNSRI